MNTTVVTKTRGEYNGSYPPGINVEKIDSVDKYGVAIKRLENRFDFLVGEYETIKISFDEADSLIEKAKVLKERDSKAKQIQGVLNTKKELEKRRPVIEEQERASIENATFDEFTF